MPDSSYVEFDPPAGYEAPEGAIVDQDFDGLATFRVKSNGKMCLIKVGGLPVGKSQAPEKSTGERMKDACKSGMTKTTNEEEY
jgi:hypothetical protein